MKRFLTSIALAVCALTATAAPVVDSGSLTVSGFEHSPTPGATVFAFGNPISAGVGGLVATFDDGFFPQDFVVYCVDLFSAAGAFGTPIAYDKITLAQTEFAAALEPANITALSKLFTFNAGTTNLDATKSAGMQLAVWELLYDGEGDSLSTGIFTAGSAPAAAKVWANTLLAGALTSSADYGIILFSDQAYTSKDSGNQNMVTAFFNPGDSCEIGNECTVPEPTGLTLAGLGLGALALTRRRKTRVKA